VDEYDTQWQTTWQDVYNQPSLNVSWYSVLGNHDYTINPEAEIDFAKNSLDWRWVMDGHFYSRTFMVGNMTVLILFIDTILLDDYNSGFYVENSTGKYLEEMNWITSTLKGSTADWKFVVGHYPVYSIGEHGDTPSLKYYFQPVLETYGVDAYICGHDHTLQHLSKGGVEYYVSGNGGKLGSLRSTSETSADYVYFAQVNPGFMVHEVTKTKMTVSMINSQGKKINSFVQVKSSEVPTTPKPPPATPAPTASYTKPAVRQSSSEPPSQTSTSQTSTLPIVLGTMLTIGLITGGVIIFRKRRKEVEHHRIRAEPMDFEESVQFESIGTAQSP
jgi:tartrate-resistant acid phosphatase type 5